MERPLLIDCILYNGDRIVELRLAYLYDLVDFIYITESRYTFTGIRKEQLFFETNTDLFQKYIDKIVFLEIEKFPGTDVTWNRETYQRNYAQKFIQSKFSGQKYIVICCDVDEIPRDTIVKCLPDMYPQLSVPQHLEMKFYYYNFNWVQSSTWSHQFVINDIGLSKTTLQECRGARQPIIPNAGWHFSYFMSCQEIRAKLESFSHTEYNTEKHKNYKHIAECTVKGTDLFGNAPMRASSDAEFKDLPCGWENFAEELKLLQSNTYQFTNTWFENESKRVFTTFLLSLNQSPVKILEIGCHEGRSTVWLIDNLLGHANSRMTSIDPYSTDDKTSPVTDGVYKRFLHNVSVSKYPEKLTFYKEYSQTALPKLLITEAKTFDFIYIDASHYARHVLFDAINSWCLLKVGGILWFDDYGPETEGFPRTAIDGFLRCINGFYELLHKNWSLGIRKTSE